MFGINSVEQVGQIVEGWANYALGKEGDLADQRLKICKECPLYNPDKDTCDSRKCYNPNTQQVVTIKSDGVICGCGCYMQKKTRVKNAKCILKKW